MVKYRVTNVLLLALSIAASLHAPTSTAQIPPPTELLRLCWVAYAPTHFNPERGIFPTIHDIRADLEVLRSAGFDGLITYAADHSLGTEIPRIAQETGFSGFIMGIWNPIIGSEEYQNAVNAASLSVTKGYIVGNEGLGTRYSRQTLESVMNQLRDDTDLPSTTSEEWGDYVSDLSLLDLGDWVAPNAHPYFAGKREPTEAVEWTVERYEQFLSLTDKPVLFKEVGLPSAGAMGVSPARQAEYYRDLWRTDTVFAFFEAFNQPWKDTLPVEPHWGLFYANRAEKLAASIVCGQDVPPTVGTSGSAPIRNHSTNASPTLTWSRIDWAVEYEVQIDRARTFTQPLTFSQILPSTTLTVTLPVLTNGAYFWRVRARRPEGGWGFWSIVERLTVDTV